MEILLGLTDLPLWVSIAVAAFFYLGLTFVPPVFAGQSLTGGVFAKALPPFAPWLALAALGAGAIGVMKRWWRRFLLSRATGVEEIRKLGWPHLELVVGQAYRAQQYAVTERGGAHPDDGIDLELRRDGELVIVQCKQWKRPVPVQRVRELLGVVTAERASRGVLVAPGGFTRDALAFAAGKPIELIDGFGLAKLTEQARGSSQAA